MLGQRARSFKRNKVSDISCFSVRFANKVISRRMKSIFKAYVQSFARTQRRSNAKREREGRKGKGVKSAYRGKKWSRRLEDTARIEYRPGFKSIFNTEGLDF